jgi:hypothetical protein
MSERKIDTTPTWTAADGPAKEELAVVSFTALIQYLLSLCHSCVRGGAADVDGMSVRSELMGIMAK